MTTSVNLGWFIKDFSLSLHESFGLNWERDLEKCDLMVTPSFFKGPLNFPQMGRLEKNLVAEEKTLSKKRTNLVLNHNLQSRLQMLCILLLSLLGSWGNLSATLPIYFQRALNYLTHITSCVLGREVGRDFITASLRGREKVAITGQVNTHVS